MHFQVKKRTGMCIKKSTGFTSRSEALDKSGSCPGVNFPVYEMKGKDISNLEDTTLFFGNWYGRGGKEGKNGVQQITIEFFPCVRHGEKVMLLGLMIMYSFVTILHVD